MDIFLLYFFCVGGLISTINTTLYYTYFWQLKEYRWDRMKDFLSTSSGWRKIFTPAFYLKILAFLAVLLIIIQDISPIVILTAAAQIFLSHVLFYLTIIILTLELIDVTYRLFKRKLYRPDRTFKALLIIFLTLIGAMLLFRVPQFSEFYPLNRWLIHIMPLQLTWAAITAPFINALIVAIFYPITLFSKRFVLAKARRKLAQMQGLKVVGITGSYGKSSVKEFLAQILSGKYQVLKTPGNTNTEIGVAGIILKHLKPEDEVFIVEAGAYKMGEIKKICDMVAPRLAIITAVKDAHLSLFGSLENIKKAKFELIEGLPEFGTAIFNADNDGSEDLAKRASGRKLGKIVRYGTKAGVDLKAIEITETLDGITFQIEDVQFTAPLPGRHNVSNLLAAIAAAQELGMKLTEIAEKVKHVQLRDHTLTAKKVSDNLIVVDDTYNANPDGVVAALNYLNLYQGWQKIFVFPGMLELGEKTDEEHRRVARKIAEVCDMAIFTSHDFERPLMEELKKASFSNFQFIVEEQDKLLNAIKEKTGQVGVKSVILFSSRGAEQVIKNLINAA